jgi:exodeoxyribonuclease X
MFMPFGKHRGKRLSQLPGSYLSWLLREADLEPWLKQALEQEERRRGKS